MAKCFGLPNNFEKVELFFKYFWRKLACKYLVCKSLLSSFITNIVLMFSTVHSFWIHLAYFIFLSLLGYLAMKIYSPTSFRAREIDVFFMSVSAITVSSMSTLEMEVFSNTQLVILTILMFVGGEVFTSMLGLQFAKFKYLKKRERDENRVDSVEFDSSTCNSIQIELSNSVISEKPNNFLESKSLDGSGGDPTKYNAIRSLSYVVLSFLLLVSIVGSVLVLVYVSIVPSAKRVLTEKGISRVTFSVFSTVSTFVNCGFIPTNENMLVFKNNTGLLLILILQMLLGNTLYPVCLRLLILVLEKVTKRREFGYMLRNTKEMGYSHLLTRLHCWCLALTVFGLVIVQFVLFVFMEWNNSDVMDGFSSNYAKVVGSLFQVTNSRHTGESVFDLSHISSAILVVFVVMMYLPPYTSFMPTGVTLEDHDEQEHTSDNSTSDFKNMMIKSERRKKRIGVGKYLLSPLSYLAILVTLVCITEREKLKQDPLNFNVLNIVVEVISAYGNVGLSAGYSCERKINYIKGGGGGGGEVQGYCKDAWYGFAGRWSYEGKVLLIIVMFFGRLKKFSLRGGQFWHLS